MFPWWLLRLHFFTRRLYFYHNSWWERDKNQIFKYFEGFYWKLRRKLWKFINTVDSGQLEYSECWTIHTNSEDISEIKLTSLLPSAQNSHLMTWTLLVLNIFFFDRNNYLTHYKILNFWKLNAVGPISSLAMHKILFSSFWLAILLILILKSTPTQDFQQKIGNQWEFCTVKSSLEVILT